MYDTYITTTTSIIPSDIQYFVYILYIYKNLSKRMRIGILTLLLKHFLIYPIFCKGSTLINFGFFIKEDLVCGFNFRFYKILTQSTKSRKVDAITSIFTKNSKFCKIQTLSPISAKFLKENYPHFISIVKKYLVQNLNLAELGAKMPVFRKIQNFMKFQRSDGLFPNSLPNVLED